MPTAYRDLNIDMMMSGDEKLIPFLFYLTIWHLSAHVRGAGNYFLLMYISYQQDHEVSEYD